MARRRKKAKTAPRPSQTGSNGPTPSVEKALPSLPPGAVPTSAFAPEAETTPELYSEGGPSPSERQTNSKANAAAMKRENSPMSEEARRGGFLVHPVAET